MTLLFFDGFQDGILAPKPEWNAGGAWNTALIGRDGSSNGAVQSGINAFSVLPLPSAAATCIAGTGYRSSTLANLSAPLTFGSSTVSEILIVLNAAGFLEVRRTTNTGTLLGTSSGHAPISASGWFFVEGKVVLNSAGAGSVVVQLNGIQVINLTGVTTATTTASVTHIRCNSGGTSGTYAWDDFYVCDAVDATATQGQPNNDFLGDIRIASLYPSAAGDSTGWTPSVGANYTTVDEVPANTTDFVSVAASSSGTRDLYQLTDISGTISTVYGVRVGLYAMKSDAGNALVKPVLKESGGTVTAQAAQAISLAVGPIYGPMLPTKPSAPTTAWTTADVNALQVGQEVA